MVWPAQAVQMLCLSQTLSHCRNCSFVNMEEKLGQPGVPGASTKVVFGLGGQPKFFEQQGAVLQANAAADYA